MKSDYDNAAAVFSSKSQRYSNWNKNGGIYSQVMIFLFSYAKAKKYLGVRYDNSSKTKSRERLQHTQ